MQWLASIHCRCRGVWHPRYVCVCVLECILCLFCLLWQMQLAPVVVLFCWRSRDELINNVLLWTPSHCRAKTGRPARTYIQQLCEDMGCGPEDLLEARNDRERCRERVRDIRADGMTWWWWCISLRIFPTSVSRCYFPIARVVRSLFRSPRQFRASESISSLVILDILKYPVSSVHISDLSGTVPTPPTTIGSYHLPHIPLFVQSSGTV